MHSDTDSNDWIKMVYTLVICDLNDTTRMRDPYVIHTQSIHNKNLTVPPPLVGTQSSPIGLGAVALVLIGVVRFALLSVDLVSVNPV